MRINFLTILLLIYSFSLCFAENENSKQVYSISILPVYSLTYIENQNEFDIIFDSITDDIKLNSDYLVYDKDKTIEILNSKNINTDTILLDDDLIEIRKILDVDYVIYNIVSIDDNNNTIIYSKSISRKGEVESFYNEAKNINQVLKKIKSTIFASGKKNDVETKPKINVVSLNPENITTINKVGIAVGITGATLTLTGTILFLYDVIYYFEQVKNYKAAYIQFEIPYSTYSEAYYTNIILFSTGVGLLSLGIGSSLAAIPMILYKDNKSIVNLFIDGNIQMACAGISISF